MTKWIRRLLVALAIGGALSGCAGFDYRGVPDIPIYGDTSE